MESNQIKIYINNFWRIGDLCLDSITDIKENMRATFYVTEKRKEFIKKLEEEGYQIIYKKSEIDEDTICLIMDEDSIGSADLNIEEYKKLFDKKIFGCAGPNLNYPFTISLKEYFKKPFFPAVFKNELENGGHDKLLIETEEQLEILKTFYNDYYTNPKYKEAFDCVIMQQYLETPSNYTTYMRVLIGGSGKIFGCSLKYSKKSFANNNIITLFESILLNPNSKYYLNAKKMFNYYSGGGNIVLFKEKYTKKETDILKEHGFTVPNLTLPLEVEEVCKNIMKNCNREIGVLCGIDFMLNKYDNKWYYLENQSFPAIEEWLWTEKIKVPKIKNVDDYLTYLDLELKLRYEALMLLIEKRKKEQEENHALKLKQKHF